MPDWNPERLCDFDRIGNDRLVDRHHEHKGSDCNLRSAPGRMNIVEPADLHAAVIGIDADFFRSFSNGRREVVLHSAAAAARECHVTGPRIIRGDGTLDEQQLEIVYGRAHEKRDRGSLPSFIRTQKPWTSTFECPMQLADAWIDQMIRAS